MASPAVKIYRGSQLEAFHDASIAVVNEKGELTHYYGDPDAVFMTRSSIKPFQLMPLLLSGASDKFNFTSKQLAIMCGSHNGSDEHKNVVLSNLALAGNSPKDLQCGCHRPLYMIESETYPENKEDKDPARHNCSGKHSGFLALARFLGEDISDYINPNSQTQTLVRQTVSSFCEYPLEETFYGTDGCSAPNFPVPLKNLALGFVKLAIEQGKDKKEKSAVSRIKTAMIEHPKMVSGEKRLDYNLMRSFAGNIICKIGAEAIEGIGFINEKIGVAVKIHDGANRALGPVIIETLKQLKIIKSIENFPLLKQYNIPKVKNVRGLETGTIICDFILKTV